jgi:hypothetical protein
MAKLLRRMPEIGLHVAMAISMLLLIGGGLFLVRSFWREDRLAHSNAEVVSPSLVKVQGWHLRSARGLLSFIRIRGESRDFQDYGGNTVYGPWIAPGRRGWQFRSSQEPTTPESSSYSFGWRMWRATDHNVGAPWLNTWARTVETNFLNIVIPQWSVLLMASMLPAVRLVRWVHAKQLERRRGFEVEP